VGGGVGDGASFSSQVAEPVAGRHFRVSIFARHGAPMGIGERWREKLGDCTGSRRPVRLLPGPPGSKVLMLGMYGIMTYILDRMQSICYNDMYEGTGENEAETG
jgi:hypothetical protein